MIFYLAQVAPTDPILNWLNYGVMGLFVIGLILGWVWVRPAVNHAFEEFNKTIARLEKDLERVEAHRDELQKIIGTQLAQATSQLQKVYEMTDETLHYVEALAIQQRRGKD